eukprot:3925985-Amphidinium_carterae.1
MRKKRFCRCCGGWCSLMPLWIQVAESFKTLAANPLRRAIAFELKCDLAELATSLGLASPASTHPCVLCK